VDLHRIRRLVKLRDLDVLITVVEAGSMRKATERLHLSQPAVTAAIQELEDAAGVPLLERSHQGVVATAYGEVLIRRARAAFDELVLAGRELDHLGDPDSGDVHLGGMETINAGLLGAAIQRMRHSHPRMRFWVYSGEPSELLGPFLQERRCDVVVCRPYELPLPPGVAGEPLFHDRLLVLAGQRSRWAARHSLSLADLCDVPWILAPNETLPHSPVARAFAAVGLPLPAARILTASLNLRLHLLAADDAVTVMPASAHVFGPQLAGLHVLPIELPAWEKPTLLARLSDRVPTPAVEAVCAQIRALAARMCTQA
jgi:DNA-binding transcriptional LysR family regulator